MVKPIKFTDRMRRFVIDCGIPRNQISKATGIDPAVLSRFVHGHTGLSMESLDALADYFGWEIKTKGK